MPRLLLLVFVVFTLDVVGRSEPPRPTSAEAEVSRLVGQLGSPVFRERETASKSLADIGEPARGALCEATRSKDPEVRRRARKLLPGMKARLYPVLFMAGHKNCVTRVAFSPDGSRALSGSHDKTARLWDTRTGKELRRFGPHPGRVFGVAFSPDGGRVLSCGEGGALWLWDVRTGALMRKIETRNELVLGVAFAPDGHRVLSCSGCIVQLWDARTGKEIWRRGGHQIYSAVFSREGQWVLTADYSMSVLRDAATGKELRRFEGVSGRVVSVALSPDGRMVLSGGDKQPVVLWEREAKRPLRSFKAGKDIVCEVAFSPDGGRVLSGALDGMLHLWDVETGRELDCRFAHESGVVGVAFSPDGRRVLSGGKDQAVRLWELAK